MKVRMYVFALLLLAPLASAQVFNFEQGRAPFASISAPWRFQIGDNPAWADPSFDDSRWALIQANRSWTAQGFPASAEMAWYRIRLDMPAKTMRLSLLLPLVYDSYQVFANGRLIGQIGGMPPHGRLDFASRCLFEIPADLVQPSKPLYLAIRVWHDNAIMMPRYSGPGIDFQPDIGESALVAQLRLLSLRSMWWELAMPLLGIFANFITAIAGFALFGLRRSEREYLWFGLAQVFWGLQLVAIVYAQFAITPWYRPGSVMTAAPMLGMLCNLEFFVTLLGQRKRCLYWTAAVAVVLSAITAIPSFVGWMGFGEWYSIAAAVELVYAICVPTMLVRGAIEGNRDARLLLVPFTLSFCCNVVSDLLNFPVVARIGWVQAFSAHFMRMFVHPFPVDAASLFGDLAMFSVVAVLVARYARSRRDEERLASELEAARAVQHVLIPDEIPSIPGLHVECAYKPASQVGGDFFQILPLAGGGALLAIGDVSGKGMPAAMTVSLVVGMMRMLIRTVQRPAQILAAINENLLGRTPGGFTTCLMLAIGPDGTVTASNAGHIAPYVNGREMHVENGLPLGLDANAEYMETRFTLAPGDGLTLLTDGVLEARNAQGELFGFERAASLSRSSAAEIARAAQQFGQEDDITVLSIKRRAPGTATVARLEPSALHPAPA